MEKKRHITVYTDLNGPHKDQIKQGIAQTPEERYRRFFAMQARLWAIKGRPKPQKSISVRKPSWI